MRLAAGGVFPARVAVAGPASVPWPCPRPGRHAGWRRTKASVRSCRTVRPGKWSSPGCPRWPKRPARSSIPSGSCGLSPCLRHRAHAGGQPDEQPDEQGDEQGEPVLPHERRRLPLFHREEPWKSDRPTTLRLKMRLVLSSWDTSLDILRDDPKG